MGFFIAVGKTIGKQAMEFFSLASFRTRSSCLGFGDNYIIYSFLGIALFFLHFWENSRSAAGVKCIARNESLHFQYLTGMYFFETSSRVFGSSAQASV